MLIVRVSAAGRIRGFGRVPEWLKGTGCKPVGFGLRRFESYPFHQAPTPGFPGEAGRVPRVEPGGCSSMVELQPSKLATRVRFPSPAPKLRIFGAEGKQKPIGSRLGIPVKRSKQEPVPAHRVERRWRKLSL